jgi:hypothetical protein
VQRRLAQHIEKSKDSPLSSPGRLRMVSPLAMTPKQQLVDNIVMTGFLNNKSFWCYVARRTSNMSKKLVKI